MENTEEQGYSEEEVREMTDGMLREAFPDFSEEKIKEVVDGTAERFMEEFGD